MTLFTENVSETTVLPLSLCKSNKNFSNNTNFLGNRGKKTIQNVSFQPNNPLLSANRFLKASTSYEN